MSNEETFVDVLRSWAARRPENAALTFLEDGEVPAGTLTYESLDRRAREIAVGIRKIVQTGDRVLLLHPPGLEFATAFFGCLYAGVLPVPAYPPRNPRHFPRIEAILEDADARCVLTQADFQARLAAWLEQRGGTLPVICTDTLIDVEATDWEPCSFSPDVLAFLQYTSGSTGHPKGVMVTHGNLMSNQRMMCKAFGHSEGVVGVSWLPIYHDMGLIGGLMQPLFMGGHSVLMSPAAFLQKPRRWLAALTAFRASSSGGPNFAFRLCTNTIKGEQKIGLDLSALKVLFSGSEPINAADLLEFAEAFREVGFRREALYCGYGMAEATLLATCSAPGVGPVLELVDGDGLAVNEARPPHSDSSNSRIVVGCGPAGDGHEVAIVGADSGGPDGVVTQERRILEDGQVGEIWLRGASVARGYWRKPDLTREVFGARLEDARPDDGGPFMRTGDLGFLRSGELFVTGRIKDLIIIRGRNHYPRDIELTVQGSHAALRGDGGAAFSVEVDNEERLVVIQEIDRHRHGDAPQAAAIARAAVAEMHEIAPYAVVIVRQSGVPKTSSGKIQRRASARAFLEGSLPVVYEWKEAPVTVPVVVHLPIERSREDIEDFLRQRLSSSLGISPEEVDDRQPFNSFGLDSLQTVALLGEVEEWLGRSLSPTSFWNHPTIADFAAHVAGSSLEPSAAHDERN